MHSFLLLPATQRFLSTQKKPGTALIIFSVKHFGGYFLFLPKPGMQLWNERSFWCEIIGLKIQKGSNGIHLSHVPPASQPMQVRARWVVREGKAVPVPADKDGTSFALENALSCLSPWKLNQFRQFQVPLYPRNIRKSPGDLLPALKRTPKRVGEREKWSTPCSWSSATPAEQCRYTKGFSLALRSLEQTQKLSVKPLVRPHRVIWESKWGTRLIKCAVRACEYSSLYLKIS